MFRLLGALPNLFHAHDSMARYDELKSICLAASVGLIGYRRPKVLAVKRQEETSKV
jgi:hypothetical protein